ncbi:aldolase catalytic domain-containing protein [Marinoscillum sp.]|uniref:aldolase catalytic domain-containing protein n=1 Tax=Marinoscillum sp. TaxID=2024838 RepID=UPI003BA896D0
MDFEILDCTIRDGGYYTNWDFSDEVVDVYLKSFNELPIDYLEIGYRSNPLTEYLGKFFYCPVPELIRIKNITNKKLAIILNEKDVRKEDVHNLLDECKGILDLVRIAVDPKNIVRAVGLAREIKKIGFEVAFNVMYMSEWTGDKGFAKNLSLIEDSVDYFYMVDSFGGVTPNEIEKIYNQIRPVLNCKIGFHGHNNLELALINSLRAIELGADIIDATVLGMGRGAGNLKTELLLTYLNSKNGLEIDFNQLSKVVDKFAELQEEYNWGTNLPYMVSGANSLPQKTVMEWVTKRFYSFNSILRALKNQSVGRQDNIKLATYKFDGLKNSDVLLVGGGASIIQHKLAIKEFLKENDDIVVIHASSKNGLHFRDLDNPQIFCLIGNEGYRLESIFNNQEFTNKSFCLLPPYPRKMGTYLPEIFKERSYEIESINFVEDYEDSHTSLAIQIAIELQAKNLYIAGYDGYPNTMINTKEQELFLENQRLFDLASEHIEKIVSLSPTKYDIKTTSIYSLI